MWRLTNNMVGWILYKEGYTVMNAIKFFDKGFEKAVRAFIKKKYTKITQADLLNIDSIWISPTNDNGFNVPWIGTGDAYNTIFPKLKFNTSNSDNKQWLSDLQLFSHIKALHIYTPVDDLSYLKDLMAPYLNCAQTKPQES